MRVPARVPLGPAPHLRPLANLRHPRPHLFHCQPQHLIDEDADQAFQKLEKARLKVERRQQRSEAAAERQASKAAAAEAAAAAAASDVAAAAAAVEEAAAQAAAAAAAAAVQGAEGETSLRQRWTQEESEIRAAASEKDAAA